MSDQRPITVTLTLGMWGAVTRERLAAVKDCRRQVNKLRNMFFSQTIEHIYGGLDLVEAEIKAEQAAREALEKKQQQDKQGNLFDEQ